MKNLPILTFALLLFSTLSAQDGHYADINGMSMYYETYGEEDGKPIFLLHYWTHTSQLWKEHVEVLKNDFRVIVPDLRGHGKSQADLTDFEMQDSAEDILALMDHLGIEKMNGAGVSYGGFTLLHLAVLAPERVESMIVVGATHYWGPETRKFNESFAIKNMNEEAIENFSQRHENGREQFEMIMSKFNSFQNDYTSMNFTPPILSTIQAKTLIVMGDKDF